MGEFVEGSAFWASSRPRQRCSDCNRPVTWGTIQDLYLRFPAEEVLYFEQLMGSSTPAYWCSCGMFGAFTPSMIA